MDGQRQMDGRALAGVRALLLDMDGVLVSRGRPIPGAGAAIARLDVTKVPFRVVTNTSLSSRAALAGRLARGGIPIPAARIVTALSATVTHFRGSAPGSSVYLLGSTDAVHEFTEAGVPLLSNEEVDAGARADVVVVGDSEDRLSYENLNRAFRQVRDGAAFVAMHRNPWWLTAAGPRLDSGALVAGLEYATGRRADVAGKPSPAFFRAAFADLATEAPGLRHGQVLMIGDDLWTDLAPARRLGIRVALVLTGKHRDEDVAAAARRAPRPFIPDLVSPSLARLVDALQEVLTGPGGAGRAE